MGNTLFSREEGGINLECKNKLVLAIVLKADCYISGYKRNAKQLFKLDQY